MHGVRNARTLRPDSGISRADYSSEGGSSSLQVVIHGQNHTFIGVDADQLWAELNGASEPEQKTQQGK